MMNSESARSENPSRRRGSPADSKRRSASSSAGESGKEKRKKPKAARCRCGEVVFDLRGKKAGAKVVCPACRCRWTVKEDEDGGKRLVRKKTTDKSVRRTPASETGTESAGEETKKKSEKKAGKKRPAKTETKAKEPPAEKETGKKDADKAQAESKKAKKNGVEKAAAEGVERRKKIISERTAGDEKENKTRLSASVSTRRTLSRRRGAVSGDEDDEGPRPWTPERIAAAVAVGVLPLGLLLIAGGFIYDIATGRRALMTRRIFGFTIRGNDWRVWVGGALLGGLIFFGFWVLHVYFFVHLKKLKEAEDKKGDAEKAAGNGSSASQRRTRETKRSGRYASVRRTMKKDKDA